MTKFSRLLALFMFAVTIAGVAQAQTQSPDTSLPGPFGPPSWDTQYPAKERFLVLDQFNDEAVLDRETGLVWQRAIPDGTYSWAAALEACNNQLVGNRRGWRLPSYEEMSTLIDPKHTNPALPPNNPFTNFLPTDQFWTSTTRPTTTQAAWIILVNNAADLQGATKDLTYRIWCVRGGQATTNPF